MDQVWICGRYKKGKFPNSEWDIQGAFTTKGKAIQACRDNMYFIAPLELDKEIPHKTKRWPGLIYPSELRGGA